MTRQQLVNWLDAHVGWDVTEDMMFRANREFARENIALAKKYDIDHPMIDSLTIASREGY